MIEDREVADPRENEVLENRSRCSGSRDYE